MTDGVAGAVIGAASMVGDMVGGPLKAATDAVSEASMETLVLADNHMAYLPILGSPAEQVASAAMGAAADLVGGPVGQAVEAVAGLLSPSLELDLLQTHGRENQVAIFSAGDEARPESIFLSDFDFRRPMLKLRSHASTHGSSDPLGAAVEASATGMATLSLSSSGWATTRGRSALSWGRRGWRPCWPSKPTTRFLPPASWMAPPRPSSRRSTEPSESVRVVPKDGSCRTSRSPY